MNDCFRRYHSIYFYIHQSYIYFSFFMDSFFLFDYKTQSFVDACCDTLWKVADGKITSLENLEAYKKEVRAGMVAKGMM